MAATQDRRARRSDRATVWTAAALLAAAAAIWRSTPLVGAAATLAAAALVPGLASPLAGGLSLLARALGRVNAWVLLAFAFLVVLTPLALVRRLLGRGHPAFRAPREASSTWVVRSHRFGPDDLTKPW